jgi:hypothetical protein
MKRWAAIVLGSVALAVAVYALWFRDSDEERVRKTVRRAADAVAVIEGESPIMRATRVRSELIAVLAPDVSVDIPDLTELNNLTSGRDPLIGVAIGATQLWQRAEIGVTFSRVQSDGASAFADATVTVSASRAGSAEREVRRCSFRLVKRDGVFRITEVTVYPR